MRRLPRIVTINLCMSWHPIENLVCFLGVCVSSQRTLVQDISCRELSDLPNEVSFSVRLLTGLGPLLSLISFTMLSKSQIHSADHISTKQCRVIFLGKKKEKSFCSNLSRHEKLQEKLPCTRCAACDLFHIMMLLSRNINSSWPQ